MELCKSGIQNQFLSSSIQVEAAAVAAAAKKAI